MAAVVEEMFETWLVFLWNNLKHQLVLIRAIEVAFHTTKRFSSSSLHNKAPFMTYISAIDLTYLT